MIYSLYRAVMFEIIIYILALDLLLIFTKLIVYLIFGSSEAHSLENLNYSYIAERINMKPVKLFAAAVSGLLIVCFMTGISLGQTFSQIGSPISFGAPAKKMFVLEGASVDTVFLATIYDLKVLSVNHASPGSPTSLSALDYTASDQIMSLYVRSPYIYIGTANGMLIKHFTNPTPDTVTDLTGLPISAIALNNTGTRAYAGIASPDSGYKIIDVTTPSSTSILGGDTLTAGSVTSMAYRTDGGGSDTLFVAARDMGGAGGGFLRVYNVSTPASTVYLTHNATGSATYYMDIEVTSDSIYVADLYNGYSVFDRYGAPPMTSAASTVPVDSGASQINIMGDSLVIISNTDGLYTVDMQTGLQQAGPVRIYGNWPFQIHSTFYNGIKIYGLFREQGLQTLTLSTVSDTPVHTGSGYPTGYFVLDAVSGMGYTYLSNGGIGLRVIDLQGQTEAGGSPFSLSTSPNPTYTQLAIANQRLYAVVNNNDIDIIDISNPSTPTLITTFAGAGTNITDIEISDSLLIIADGDGVNLLNVANSSSPALLGAGVSAAGGVRDVMEEKDCLYLSKTGGGFDIWDISTPSTPSYEGGNSDLGAGVFDIDGDEVFYASHDTVYLVDVSSPSAPTVSGSLYEFNGAFIGSIALSGGYLHVGSGSLTGGRIDILNISDTSAVFIADSAMVSSLPTSLFIDGLFLNAVSQAAGWYFYQDDYGRARLALESRSGLPQDTVTVPLGLFDDLSSVGAISFEMGVTFDTTFAEFIGATSGNALSSGIDSLLFNVVTGTGGIDTAKIAWADTASISGPDTMLFLRFRIKAGAPVQPLVQKTEIDIEEMTFNEGFPSVEVYTAALQVVPRFGDADGSGHVSTTDASRILQWVTGIPPEPQIILADVSDNGEIRAYDAALILFRILTPGFSFPVEDHYGIYMKEASGRTEENARIIVSQEPFESVNETKDIDFQNVVYTVSMEDINEVSAAEMTIDFGDGLDFMDYSLPDELKHFNVEFMEDGSRVRISMAGGTPVSEDGILIQLIARVTDTDAVEPLEISDFYLNESGIKDITGALSALPKTYSLKQNYPNPFNPVTNIKYQLPSESKVNLIIYNILGQEVRTLVHNDLQRAGYYTLQWDGRDNSGVTAASGVYFYRIKAGNYTRTMKMLFIK